MQKFENDSQKDETTTPEPGDRIGFLPDGRQVSVRRKSTYKTPTLEVYDSITKESQKIRYTKG
jgi:hypothetical protein